MEDDDDYGKVRFLCPRRAPAVTFASNSILFERCCIELVQSMSAGWAWAPDKKLPECDKGPPPPTTSRIDGRHPTGLGFCWKEIFTFFISGGAFSMAIFLFDPVVTKLGAHIHTAVFSFSLFILLSYRIAVLSLAKTTQLKWCTASDSRRRGRDKGACLGKRKRDVP